MSKGKKGALALVAAMSAGEPANITEPVLGGSNGGPTLEEEIKEWGRRAQGVQDDFHPLCIRVLERVMETQNATIAKQLQNAMPKILRKREFASWLANVSPIRLYNEDNSTSNFRDCELRKPEDKFYRAFDIEKAKAEPFFEKKEEVKALDPSKMDLARTLMTPIQTLLKAILGEEGGKTIAPGSSHAETLAKLNEHVGAYKALAHIKKVPEMGQKVKDRVKEAQAKLAV